MLKLLKNCSVYAPKYAGKKDILIMGERIHAVADDLSAWQAAPEIEVYDINGAAVCPGIVDTHVHITGGGGEQGPVSRTPEIRLSELTLNGVTTVVSLSARTEYQEALKTCFSNAARWSITG